MARVRHFDYDRIDHGHVRSDGHPIIEESRIIEPAVLVVDVSLIERPADALRHAALDLTLDIVRVDSPADILNRGVAHDRSEEHTSELQSLMRISYAVFCLKKKKKKRQHS